MRTRIKLLCAGLAAAMLFTGCKAVNDGVSDIGSGVSDLGSNLSSGMSDVESDLSSGMSDASSDMSSGTRRDESDLSSDVSREDPSSIPESSHPVSESAPASGALSEPASETAVSVPAYDLESLDNTKQGWGQGVQLDVKNRPLGSLQFQEKYGKYDAYFIAEDTPTIYLTFDAGYENGCTEPILDALAKHNVKAAFFVVGNYIEQNPDLVRRMLREGHIVGNHTYHHYDMSKLSDEAAFNQELTSLETLYRETTGEDMPRYYRPPQGIYSEKNLEMAQKLGYRTVFWSLAYVDWYQDNQPTDEQAFSKLVPRIHPGAVVLLHSTSATNARILDELLAKWEALGYRFASLEELAGERAE